MADEGEIVVNEEARVLMQSLETHNPGAPSVGASGQVMGASQSAGAQDYRTSMSAFGSAGAARLTHLIELIRNDCKSAVDAIDDLHRQDDEIMRLLKSYESDVAAVALTSGVTTGAPNTSGSIQVSASGGQSEDTSW